MLTATIVFAISGISNASAQGCAFSNGTVGINLGLGLGTSHYWHHNSNFFVPTFNAAVDYAFLGNIINSHGSISGGGYFGIGQGSEKYYNGHSDDKYKNGRWRLGTRGALHYTWVSNLDTYAGVGLGVRHESGKWNSNSPNVKTSDFDCYGFGGARYDFGGIAVYSELETCRFATFQIGLSIIL